MNENEKWKFANLVLRKFSICKINFHVMFNYDAHTHTHKHIHTRTYTAHLYGIMP